MKVGEVARRAGVNVETLRYYERRGLLPPPDREPSGHRRYDEDTVRFLRAIKEAQAVGFTLTEIGEYLRAARRSERPSETLRIRMASKIDEIDARIAGLRRMREELARVVGCACDSLDHCTCGAAYLARRGREPTTRPTLLHVTNGESAGNTLRATSLGGAVLPWNDVLHEGPVPAVPRRELLEVRAAFLSGCGWGSRTRDPLLARAPRPAAGPRAPRRRPGRPLVRARPLRPAPADRRAGARGRGRGAAGADRRLVVPGQAVVPRARRAEPGRARDALAEPASGDGRDARRRLRRLGSVSSARSGGARGVRGRRRAARAAPRRVAASARGAARGG